MSTQIQPQSELDIITQYYIKEIYPRVLIMNEMVKLLINSQNSLTLKQEVGIPTENTCAKNIGMEVSTPPFDNNIKSLIDKDYVKITICPMCKTKLGSNPSCFSCQGYATSSLVE